MRTIWVLCLSMCLTGCSTGDGAFMNDFHFRFSIEPPPLLAPVIPTIAVELDIGRVRGEFDEEVAADRVGAWAEYLEWVRDYHEDAGHRELRPPAEEGVGGSGGEGPGGGG